jgi:hypothetical protein
MTPSPENLHALDLDEADRQELIENLGRRRLHLTAQIEGLEAAIDEIDDLLLRLLPTGATATVDGRPAWVVRTQRRFNEAQARAVLPPQLLDAITVTTQKVDASKAKETLPPTLYRQCTVEGSPHVAKAGGRS